MTDVRHRRSIRLKWYDYSQAGAYFITICTQNREMLLGKITTTQGEHTGSPLRRVIQWFKTMTTNEYINNVKQNDWWSFSGKLWQRNYYEHIIRDETEMNKIREYIVNNPLHWTTDENYINSMDAI